MRQTGRLWDQYPELVWSNRAASDTVFIRAALTRPRFDLLLEVACAFDLDRLQSEWRELQEEDSPEGVRSQGR